MKISLAVLQVVRHRPNSAEEAASEKDADPTDSQLFEGFGTCLLYCLRSFSCRIQPRSKSIAGV